MNLETLTDEEYFAQCKLTFRTDGWSIFMQELKDQADMINDVQDMSTLENLHFAKGQLNVIGKLLNFEDMLSRTEQEALDDATDAA